MKIILQEASYTYWNNVQATEASFQKHSIKNIKNKILFSY